MYNVGVFVLTMSFISVLVASYISKIEVISFLPPLTRFLVVYPVSSYTSFPIGLGSSDETFTLPPLSDEPTFLPLEESLLFVEAPPAAAEYLKRELMRVLMRELMRVLMRVLMRELKRELKSELKSELKRVLKTNL